MHSKRLIRARKIAPRGEGVDLAWDAWFGRLAQNHGISLIFLKRENLLRNFLSWYDKERHALSGGDGRVVTGRFRLPTEVLIEDMVPGGVERSLLSHRTPRRRTLSSHRRRPRRSSPAWTRSRRTLRNEASGRWRSRTRGSRPPAGAAPRTRPRASRAWRASCSRGRAPARETSPSRAARTTATSSSTRRRPRASS